MTRYRPVNTWPGWKAAVAKLADDSSRPIVPLTAGRDGVVGAAAPVPPVIWVGICETELCMAPQLGQ